MSNEYRSAKTATATAIDSDMVRGQLERLIGHPMFSQSRRYSSLLRYLVEETLDGHSDRLKERTVGIDVFGRTPSYDTTSDPVVRTTAAQLRHRIARYYAQPGHESEIRILLPSGAYLPEFLDPAEQPPPQNGSAFHGVAIATALAVAPVREAEEEAAISTVSRVAKGDRAGVGGWFEGRRRWLAVGILTAAIGSLAAAGVALFQSTRKDAALRTFWGPVWDSSRSVLLCIGVQAIGAAQGGPGAQVNAANSGPTVRESLEANSVAWPDAIVLAQLSGLARANGQTIRLRKSNLIAFEDLRDSPDILVGGFNNRWIMRLGKNLRFRYMVDRATGLHWIEDQQNPSQRNWQGYLNAPYSGFLTDYGLITRVVDQSTEKIVVIASGIAAYGTMAAGEFLTSEKYMQMVAARAPKGWGRKNLQVAFSTEVIGGNAGPPRILATYFW
jgi:hypothetical protein